MNEFNNKKYFTITYEVVGGKRTDTIMIWATKVSDAIKEFTKTDLGVRGFKILYTEYAIVNIKA